LCPRTLSIDIFKTSTGNDAESFILTMGYEG
jgi:hypothetical protein